MYCYQCSCPFWWDVAFDRWSSGMCTHDPRRASREKVLREFRQEAHLSRMSPILWQKLLLLLLFAPRRCRHHRRRSPRCPHGLQLSRVKVSLADHMHTRSGIHYKLSSIRLFCWRSREYPFFHGRVESSFVVLLELEYVFSMESMPCFGHIAVVFQSLQETIGFPRNCFPLWETNASESCETQPNCGTLFTIATAFLSSLSLLLWEQ